MRNSHFVVMMVVAVTSLTWRSGVTAPVDENTVPEAVLAGCKDKPADIYFLLDCSSSVWIVDYGRQKEFIISMIERMDIGPNATRVGLGVFSSDFFHVLDIGGYPSKDILIRIVRSAPYFSGETYTNKALHGMRTHGFRAGVVRPHATKVGMVITDGRSRHRSDTISEARLAREDEGIWLFAVGVGGNVDTAELNAIASVPRKQFTFHVDAFELLSSLTSTLALGVCSLAQPQGDGAGCGGNERADVMFLYNAGATGRLELRQVQNFVAHVVGQLSMATGKVRVGLVSKGSQGGDIDLNQFLRPEKLIAAMRGQPKGRLAPLFKKVRLHSLDSRQGARDSARKVVVAFVDDVLQDREDVMYQALVLKYDDVQVHVLAVGQEVRMDEMKRVASSPQHITRVPSYSALQDSALRQAFMDKFCADL